MQKLRVKPKISAIYNEYKSAKQVTQERMYLETMEKVLADIDKVIIDESGQSGALSTTSRAKKPRGGS